MPAEDSTLKETSSASAEPILDPSHELMERDPNISASRETETQEPPEGQASENPEAKTVPGESEGVKPAVQEPRAEEKVTDLVTWKAPARPFKTRDRKFWVTIFAMMAVVGVILFLAEGLMPVVLLVSFGFLAYVLTTVEPETVEYKVTDRGVSFAGKRTDWESLRRFWFTRRFDHLLLVFETTFIPGRMEMVITPEVKEHIQQSLAKYIPYEEVPASALDNAANWFSKRVPSSK